MHTRRIADDSNETRPDGDGLGIPNRFHDVFIVVRGRDNEIFETSFAQIIIGTHCTLVTNTLEIVPIASVTSDSEVFCGGRILSVWFRGGSIGYARRGTLAVNFFLGRRFLLRLREV